jgi:dienelactone hydrolase
MRALLLLTILVGLLPASAARAALQTKTIEYTQDGTALEGYLAYDDAVTGTRPGVLVVQEWWGLNDYIRGRARQLAGLGYVAFAPDIYGKGVRPTTMAEAQKAATTYLNDRALMRARAQAGLDVLRRQSNVNTKQLVAIGYCFGGAVALELARSGADLVATVTFHGILNTPHPEDARNIKGKVLALTGADDPFVPPDQILAFEQEMRNGRVNWQLSIYGGAVHGFTNPANGTDPSKGIAYNEQADRRSWAEMRMLFDETFGPVRR